MIIITIRPFPCSWAASTTVGTETTVETETTVGAKTTVVIIEQKTYRISLTPGNLF